MMPHPVYTRTFQTVAHNQYKCIKYLFQPLLSRANVNSFIPLIPFFPRLIVWESHHPRMVAVFVFTIEPWTGGLDCMPEDLTLTLASLFFQKNFRLWRFLTVQINVNTPHEISYEIRYHSRSFLWPLWTLTRMNSSRLIGRARCIYKYTQR